VYTNEADVIVESFACLRGFPGDMYTTPERLVAQETTGYVDAHSPSAAADDSGEPKFQPNRDLRLSHVSAEALLEAMAFVSTLAAALDRLRQFSKNYSQGDVSRGIVWQTFAYAIGLYIFDIEGRLIGLEREFHASASESNGSQPTLLKLRGCLQPVRDSVAFVENIVETVVAEVKHDRIDATLHASKTLSVLYGFLGEATLLFNGDDGLKGKYETLYPLCRKHDGGASQEPCFRPVDVLADLNVALSIFATTLNPYIHLLQSWLHSGLLVDVHGDFFVTPGRAEGTDGAHGRRRRRGKVVRGAFSPLPKAHQFQDGPGGEPARCGAAGPNAPAIDEAFWDEGYIFEEAFVPSFLKPIAREIYLAGKSIAVMRTMSTTTFATAAQNTVASSKLNISLHATATNGARAAPGGDERSNIFEVFAAHMSKFLPDEHQFARHRHVASLSTTGHPGSEGFRKRRVEVNEMFFNDEGPRFQHFQVDDMRNNGWLTAAEENMYGRGGNLLNDDTGSFLGRTVDFYMRDGELQGRIPAHPVRAARGREDGPAPTDKSPDPGGEQGPALFESVHSVLIGGPFISELSVNHLWTGAATRTSEDMLGSFNATEVLKVSLTRPVRRLCFQENFAFVKMFREELSLIPVLDSLRVCYFFSDVQVMEPFLLKLFGQVDTAVTDWVRTLTINFRDNLEAHGAAKLSFDPDHWDATIFSEGGDGPENGDQRAHDSYDGIGALDNLKLTYHAPWPLNIVIGRESLQFYNDIMRTLIQVKRVKYQLDNLHHELRHEIITLEKEAAGEVYFLPRDAEFRSHAHSNMLFIGRLMHFINNLHNYLMERCVYGEWDDMTQAMMEAASVDDLREVHLSYLRRLHEQCLLNPKAKVVAIQIRKILNISLQCVGAIKRWIRLGSQRVEWEGDQVRRQEHVPYSAMPIEENRGLTQSLIHLDDLQLRFKKTNEFLHILLATQIKRAHDSVQHITDVLLRLDYNHFYKNSLA
jgi:hypothetical protein